MDPAFNFRAESEPFPRRVQRRSVVLAVAASVGLGGLMSLSRWVVDSERDSLARAGGAGAPTTIAGTMPGTDPGPDDLEGKDPHGIDDGARSDALVASTRHVVQPREARRSSMPARESSARRRRP